MEAGVGVQVWRIGALLAITKILLNEDVRMAGYGSGSVARYLLDYWDTGRELSA